jgi:RimJ/RimL family protein N-acetyltransferase
MDLAYPKKLEVDGEVRMQLASSQDLDLWVELAISPENAAHQLTRGNTREMAQAVAPAAVAVDGDSVGFARYTIMTGEQRAGFLTVYLEDPVLRHAKLGIDLLPEFWGRGYGTRAVTAIIKFLTGETNVIKVSAGCFSDNARCRRVLEKAGLEHCGSFSRFWMKAGEWKAGEHYELDLLKRRPARAITPERTISETDPAVAACLEPAV